MIKHLVRHGNSHALVIDKPILDLLEIDARTPLSITSDGRCLVVAPAAAARRRKAFHQALAEGNRRFGKMLRRLAD